MRIQKTANLNGGEVLAKTVMTSDYKVLLSEGSKVRKEYIEKLEELGCKEVFVEDEVSIEEVKILKDETEKKFKDKVKDIIEKHTYLHNKELVELSKTADNIIDNLLKEEKLIGKIYDIKERSPDIYEHSINICSLAILVSLKMKIRQNKIHDIGVGCLLHDLGLRYITVDYKGRDIEEFSEMELAEYKKHPIYGYSALKDETWISELSKEIVLYHHQNMDGSGYPLKYVTIPVEIEIVNICEQFDEMICGIGHRRLKVFAAISHLKRNKDILFDSSIVDVFLKFTAVYPAGSYVLTNEGEVGIVLRQNESSPDRPYIKIVYDKRGNRIQQDFVKDLLTEKDIFIEKVIENI